MFTGGFLFSPVCALQLAKARTSCCLQMVCKFFQEKATTLVANDNLKFNY